MRRQKVVKQIKALGTSQAGLPFELDMSVTIEGIVGTMAQTTEEENVPRIWVLVLEVEKSLIYFHRATAPSNVHNTSPGRTSHITASPAASRLDSEWSG